MPVSETFAHNVIHLPSPPQVQFDFFGRRGRSRAASIASPRERISPPEQSNNYNEPWGGSPLPIKQIFEKAEKVLTTSKHNFKTQH